MAEYIAATGNIADVRDALARATAPGDIVTIPSGTWSWAETLTVPDAGSSNYVITLRGQDTLGTIISSTAANGKLFLITFSANDELRVTNLRIARGAGSNATQGVFHLRSDVPAYACRIDNIYFDNVRSRLFYARGSVCGVISEVTSVATQPGSSQFLNCDHDTFPASDGTSATAGHGSMSGTVSHLGLGDARALYVEDCSITQTSGSSQGVSDGEGGARMVFRHNNLSGMHFVTHGTEGGANRGCCRIEIYENVMQGYPNRAIHLRTGAGLVFNNTITGTNFHLGGVLAHYRLDSAIYNDDYGKACGWGPYDDNDSTIYETGVHDASGGEGTYVLKVAGTPWVADEWQRYGVKNTTTGKEGFIYANTSSQIYTLGDHDVAGDDSQPTWNTGDGYEIRKMNKAIDQWGWFGGDIMYVASGQTVRRKSDNAITYPNQNSCPFYAWNNLVNGVLTECGTDLTNPSVGGPSPQTVAAVIPNRDYFNEVVGFDGTEGVGKGTLAARPAAPVTPGVAYWDTDNEILYYADSGGAWQTWFTPLEYPHPLRNVTPPVGPTITVVGDNSAAAETRAPFTMTFSCNDGTAPYTWDISAGALPGGFSLSSSTGVLSGRCPSPGTYNFTVRVTDDVAATGTLAVEIVITAKRPRVRVGN